MEFCHEKIHKYDIDKHDLIIGNLLGDACILKDGRIEVYHSNKQKDYTIWLMNLYSKFFKVKYNERVCKNKIYNKEYPQCGFRVTATNFTKLMRKIFYRPKKTINRKQLDKLTPLGLAIWYMDDGNLSFIKNKDGEIKARQLRISTHCFTYEENKIIQDYLKERWDIECKIHDDHNGYVIWMNGTQAKKFLNIIKDYIHISMYYKLCYRYFGYKSSENLCKKECRKGQCPYGIV